MKAYRYLFYKILCFLKRISLTNQSDEWNAAFIVAFLFFTNLETLLTVPLVFTGKDRLPLGEWGAVFVGLGLVYLNYRILIRDGRLERLLNEFRGEDKEKSKLGNLYVLIYAFGSFFLFLLINIIKLFFWVGVRR